jgi:hypothetical protein
MARPPLEVADLIRTAGDAFVGRTLLRANRPVLSVYSFRWENERRTNQTKRQ